MSIAAAYARYSTDSQKPTSIDDQLRRCREVAKREGLHLETRFEFSDDAITGKAEGRLKRKQYQRLIDAMESREISVVIADEISRLTRDVQEGGRLMGYAERHGVRFITADGIDTNRDGWKTIWLAKLMTASIEVESTGSRTMRGMLGQLERGYQIAQAPYGYRSVKHASEGGHTLGTQWLIYEPEATVVRQIYAWRKEGQSAARIATSLQERSVLPPGAARAKGNPYWRAASVYRLLSNAIYRGTFVWNGSSFTKARARRTRKEVKEEIFERPSLRMVTDELWYACNARESSGAKARAPRGGGKNVFSGLVRCGTCLAHLTAGTGTGMGSLYCPQCEHAKRVKAMPSWMGYSSVGAAKAALMWAMETIFTGEVRKEFHRRLAERLHGGPAKELTTCKARLKDVEQQIDKIQTFMLNPNIKAEILEPKLEVAARERDDLTRRLEQMKRATQHMTVATLQTQAAVDPLPFLNDLLSGSSEAYKARATLRRLLETFQLVARPTKGVSVFQIALRPGVTLAETSDTALVDDSAMAFEVTVSTTAKRPVEWHVQGHRV